MEEDRRPRPRPDFKIRHRRNHDPVPLLILFPTSPSEIKFYCFRCKGDLAIEGIGEHSWCWSSYLNSSGDWLMVFDAVSNIFMFNPITGDSRALPRLSSFPGIETHRGEDGSIVSYRLPHAYRPSFCLAKEAGLTYFTKAVVGSSGTVMMIHRRGFSALVFARKGDKLWTFVRPCCYYVQDIMYLNGCFYSLNSIGVVKAYDFNGCGPKEGPKVTKISDELREPARSKAYLAHSPEGKIYQVLKIKDQTVQFHKTSWFAVYELQRDSGKWLQSKDLGGYCLFLGANDAIFIRGCKDEEDYIYFTDDHFHPKFLPPPVHQDSGVYRLQQRTLGNFYPDHYKCTWPCHAWFMPTSSSESHAAGNLVHGEEHNKPEEEKGIQERLKGVSKPMRKRRGYTKKEEQRQPETRSMTRKREAKIVENNGRALKKISRSQAS